MTAGSQSTPLKRCRRAGLAATLAGCAFAIAWCPLVFAQVAAPTKAPVKSATEQGVRWSALKPAQQTALKPLEREWSGIDPRSKQKWLEMSTRFPKLTPPEQARIQDRMTEWAKLTPGERTEARMHFQEAKQLPTEDRRARWEAYQALSPEQKQQLAARAAPSAEIVRKTAPTTARTDKGGRDSLPQAKSNIVPNPASVAPPRAVAPTVLQASPGATTTLITKRPTPPGHQQTGMPKIAATPEFVNKATLLPQRGPQGAATRSAAAPASGTPPRQ